VDRAVNVAFGREVNDGGVVRAATSRAQNRDRQYRLLETIARVNFDGPQLLRLPA